MRDTPNPPDIKLLPSGLRRGALLLPAKIGKQIQLPPMGLERENTPEREQKPKPAKYDKVDLDELCLWLYGIYEEGR